MTKASKQIFECECGYTTHFEKALQAHCRFRGHKPKAEPIEIKTAETILPEVKEELEKALKKTVRKPRKKAEKEQK